MRYFIYYAVSVFVVLQTQSFKLPNVNFDANVENAHDQISQSIVHSTITSINFSALHIGCEAILLLLIVCAYKRLSSTIYQLSVQFMKLKAIIKVMQGSEKANADSSVESAIL